MNIEDIQNICKYFTSVTEDIKWENHLCFSVGDKIFLITSPDTIPVTARLKKGLKKSRNIIYTAVLKTIVE